MTTISPDEIKGLGEEVPILLQGRNIALYSDIFSDGTVAPNDVISEKMASDAFALGAVRDDLHGRRAAFLVFESSAAFRLAAPLFFFAGAADPSAGGGVGELRSS